MSPVQTGQPVDYVTPMRRFFETPWPGHRRKLLVKRSSEPGEYPQPNRIGQTEEGVSPRRPKESLINEARAIEYIRKHTTIPVPKPIAAFEDRGAFYLIQEYLTGIPAQVAPSSAHPHIVKQLEGYVEQLQALRSDTVRSFVEGHLFVVPRLMGQDLFNNAKYANKKDEYILCHGDLGWHNIAVDPKTFDIIAIFDWEFAGFYPAGMEGEHWRRCGHSSANRYRDRVDKTDITRSMYEVRAQLEGGSDAEVEAQRPLESISMYTGVNITAPNEPQTKLQERLRNLDLGYPDSLPVTHRTLGIQRAICTRKSIAESFNALGTDIEEDATASSRWTTASDDLEDKSNQSRKLGMHRLSLAYEALGLQALYELLPALHHRLAAGLDTSHKPLIIARDSLVHVPIPDIGQPVPPTLLVRNEDGDGEEAAEVSIRAFRAETYRQVEAEKWQAFHDYAKQLLLISHAALHLVPYLPQGAEDHPFDTDRILAEHRAKNIVERGQGGWKVEVVDDAEVVGELAKRDGKEVAAWGMVHDVRVAEEKEKEAKRIGREPAARARREKLAALRAAAEAQADAQEDPAGKSATPKVAERGERRGGPKK